MDCWSGWLGVRQRGSYWELFAYSLSEVFNFLFETGWGECLGQVVEVGWVIVK